MSFNTEEINLRALACACEEKIADMNETIFNMFKTNKIKRISIADGATKIVWNISRIEHDWDARNKKYNRKNHADDRSKV